MAIPQGRPDYVSPLLDWPGAVAAAGIDAGTAWHYGDPGKEQLAAENGVALFDRSHRHVLAVTGQDRLSWLHTLTSQYLSTLSDGQVTEALVLSPQGHVEHHAVVTELDGTTYLETEPGDGPGLLAYLDGMRFWSKVEVADATADLAVLRLAGPSAALLAAELAAVTDPGRAVPLPSGGFARRSDDGIELVIPRADLSAMATRLIAAGAVAAGSWASDALRIAARRPRWGVDVDERTIPNETEWLQTAVHLQKGCYRGQETVARVHNLGRPPRRLVMLNLDGSADSLPATGDPVNLAGGRTVGRVGTVAQHHEWGPIALALVKRGLGPGVPLLAGPVDAVIDPADAVQGEDRDTPVSAIDRRALREIRRV